MSIRMRPKAQVTFIISTHRGDKVLRQCVLSDRSDKPLTKGRAARLLGRAFPEFKSADLVILVDTERGWLALRSLVPEENTWIHVYVKPLPQWPDA